MRDPGTVCRSTDHECDLPEYCNGESEYCPEDIFKIDGLPCAGETVGTYSDYRFMFPSKLFPRIALLDSEHFVGVLLSGQL